jgi:hypothetical protein
LLRIRIKETDMAEGNFQVSINGFDVHLQTWDDALNRDGWADEVFVNGEVALAEEGKVIYTSTKKSRTMGDIRGFPGRVQAGSATSHGGLKGDDRFPTDTPYIRSTGLSPDRLPMLLWEGKLIEGKTVAAITPSLWEWDENSGQTLDDWLTWQTDIADTFGERIKGNLPKPFQFWIDWTVLGLDSLQRTSTDGVFGKPVSRPIGMKPDPTDSKKLVWEPQTLALTYETATNIVASQPNGLGFGVLAMECKDVGIGNGSYSLYIQVERVDRPAGAWSDLGHANWVTGLAYAAGKLWCSSGNRLWHRSPDAIGVDWAPVSEANYVSAMAGQGDRLWCANGNNKLWFRKAEPTPQHWTEVSEANGVTAMAYAGGKLWCAAQGLLWSREASTNPIHWDQIQTVGGISGLAGVGDTLYATTTGNLLLSRPANTAGPASWAQVRSNVPPGIVGLASDGVQKLWAATSANRLFVTTLS